MNLEKLCHDLGFKNLKDARDYILGIAKFVAGAGIGGSKDADDFAQDVWVWLLSQPDTDCTYSRSFLFCMLRNSRISEVRHHDIVMSRENLVMGSLYAAVVVEGESQEKAMRLELAEMESQLRGRISEEEMVALNLHLQGYKLSEIISAIKMKLNKSISPATACRRCKSAMDQLRIIFLESAGLPDPDDHNPPTSPAPGVAQAAAAGVVPPPADPNRRRRNPRAELALRMVRWLDRLAARGFQALYQQVTGTFIPLIVTMRVLGAEQSYHMCFWCNRYHRRYDACDWFIDRGLLMRGRLRDPLTNDGASWVVLADVRAVLREWMGKNSDEHFSALGGDEPWSYLLETWIERPPLLYWWLAVADRKAKWGIVRVEHESWRQVGAGMVLPRKHRFLNRRIEPLSGSVAELGGRFVVGADEPFLCRQAWSGNEADRVGCSVTSYLRAQSVCVPGSFYGAWRELGDALDEPPVAWLSVAKQLPRACVDVWPEYNGRAGACSGGWAWKLEDVDTSVDEGGGWATLPFCEIVPSVVIDPPLDGFSRGMLVSIIEPRTEARPELGPWNAMTIGHGRVAIVDADEREGNCEFLRVLRDDAVIIARDRRSPGIRMFEGKSESAIRMTDDLVKWPMREPRTGAQLRGMSGDERSVRGLVRSRSGPPLVSHRMDRERCGVAALGWASGASGGGTSRVARTYGGGARFVFGAGGWG